MKLPFLIVNGFTCGLNLVLRRKRSRFFSSVSLALSTWSSSEDDNLPPEDSNHVPASLNCVSNEGISEPFAFTTCLSNGVRNRILGSSTSKPEQFADNEMEVLEMILEEQGLSVTQLKNRDINFNEEYIIKAMNVLFYEGGSAALPLRFFKWLECSFGVKHSVRSICSLTCILVLGNLNYKAFDLLARLVLGYPQRVELVELVRVFKDIGTGRVLVTVYSMVFSCYISEKMIHEAIETFCLMKELGMYPSGRDCNSLIKSLLEFNCVDSAWDILEGMQVCNLISVTTISLFIHYYCRKGNLHFGWKLLKRMNDFGIEPDAVAYTIFIHYLCKFSYLREATCLVFKMVEMGVSPDVVLLTKIVDGYFKVARLGDAMCILKLFYVDPDVVLYNSFISKFCKDNNMEQASSVFQEMSDVGINPDCFSYTTMIDGYCKTNNARKALQFFGRMLKDGIEPSIVTYTILISCYCRRGDMGIAEFLVRKMSRKGLMPDVVVYNTLTDGYNKQGQLDEAFELLNVMKTFGVPPDVVTYNTLMHGLIMGGYASWVNELMNELMTRGFSPDKVTLTNLIGGYANKGRFEDSFSVWAYMKENNILPDVITYSALLSGYCRANLMEEATALFQKMVDAGLVPDLIVYNTLIHGFCRMGNVEAACHFINIMLENNLSPNDVTYKALVLGYAKKHATNPMESAAYKLQLILQDHGLDFIHDLYLTCS